MRSGEATGTVKFEMFQFLMAKIMVIPHLYNVLNTV